MNRHSLFSLSLAIFLGLMSCVPTTAVSDLSSSPTVVETAALPETPTIFSPIQPTAQPTSYPSSVASRTGATVVSSSPPPNSTLIQPSNDLPAPTTSPTQISLIPEMIGKFSFDLAGEEEIRAIAVSGQIALAGFGSKLNIVDILDATKPQLLSQSEALPGMIEAILTKDELAYVGSGTSMLTFDISDPSAPIITNEIVFSETVLYLALQGQTLVVATGIEPSEADEDGSGTIITLDVSQSGQAELLDSVELPWNVFALASAEDVIYVNNATDDIFFSIDISTPNNLPDPVPFPGVILIYSLQAHDEFLYMGGGLSNISAWDISSLSDPQKLWEIQATPNPDFGLSVVDGFAFARSDVYLRTFSYHGQITGPLLLRLPEKVERNVDNLVSSGIAIQGDKLVVGLGAELVIYSVGD